MLVTADSTKVKSRQTFFSNTSFNQPIFPKIMVELHILISFPHVIDVYHSWDWNISLTSVTAVVLESFFMCTFWLRDEWWVIWDLGSYFVQLLHPQHLALHLAHNTCSKIFFSWAKMLNYIPRIFWWGKKCCLPIESYICSSSLYLTYRHLLNNFGGYPIAISVSRDDMTVSMSLPNLILLIYLLVCVTESPHLSGYALFHFWIFYF